MDGPHLFIRADTNEDEEWILSLCYEDSETTVLRRNPWVSGFRMLLCASLFGLRVEL